MGGIFFFFFWIMTRTPLGFGKRKVGSVIFGGTAEKERRRDGVCPLGERWRVVGRKAGTDMVVFFLFPFNLLLFLSFFFLLMR